MKVTLVLHRLRNNVGRNTLLVLRLDMCLRSLKRLSLMVSEHLAAWLQLFYIKSDSWTFSNQSTPNLFEQFFVWWYFNTCKHSKSWPISLLLSLIIQPYLSIALDTIFSTKSIRNNICCERWNHFQEICYIWTDSNFVRNWINDHFIDCLQKI